MTNNYYQEIAVDSMATSGVIQARMDHLEWIYAEDPEELKKLAEIRKVLVDPFLRIAYDQKLEREIHAQQRISAIETAPGDLANRIALVFTYTPFWYIWNFYWTYAFVAFLNSFLVFHKGDFGVLEYMLLGWVAYEWTLATCVRNKLTLVNAPRHLFPNEGSIWLTSTLCFTACIALLQFTHSAFWVIAGQPAMWISLLSLVKLMFDGDYNRSYHAAHKKGKLPDVVSMID
jgi:hypothetical protein